MCTTGSITSENKGGGGGSDPLWKKSIKKALFFSDGFPKGTSVSAPIPPELKATLSARTSVNGSTVLGLELGVATADECAEL